MGNPVSLVDPDGRSPLGSGDDTGGDHDDDEGGDNVVVGLLKGAWN